MDLSPQQKDIVELPLGPLSVMACAGSGKTMTAVHRLCQMRRLLKDHHGIVALLSFSNVAVETFRKDYFKLASNTPKGTAFGVEIDTVDGFITGNILRPHAYRTMKCNRTPFLVEGREPFLATFKFWDGTRSNSITELKLGYENGKFKFESGKYVPKAISVAEGDKALAKLGAVGGYTHAAARYWAIKTLKEQPFVLRALARRYPHILVDEAQDIGQEHQALLEILIGAGVHVSLIGDAHQGIYEFAHADGKFLADYGKLANVTPKELNRNYRSVPEILNVANSLCGRKDEAHREALPELSGAFYIPFDNTQKSHTIGTFKSMVLAAGFKEKHGVIVCRSSDWASDWSGGGKAQGQGIVKHLVEAVIYRDKLKKMGDAFARACAAIIGLLADPPNDLLARLTHGREKPGDDKVKQRIWCFIRDGATGLPSGTLLADTEWHPAMLERIRTFITTFAAEFGFKVADNIGQKLAKKALANEPLIELPDLAQPEQPRFRVSTVHKVKGESIDAVMYVANRGHIRALLDGTGTEDGRIGYVAVTRARNLFVLAVPKANMNEFEGELIAKGFKKYA